MSNLADATKRLVTAAQSLRRALNAPAAIAEAPHDAVTATYGWLEYDAQSRHSAPPASATSGPWQLDRDAFTNGDRP